MKRSTALILAYLCGILALSSCSQTVAPDSGNSNTSIEQETVLPDSSTEADIPVEETPEPEAEIDPVAVSVIAMSGPTGMGMVQMMDEAEKGNITSHDYSFSIITAIDEVTPKIVSGEAAFATVPANVASVLYNNSNGAVQVLAINTLGVLYVVENGDSIQTVADLEGKTIYAAGKGATPDYALSYILEENGLLDSVTIEWKSEQAEVVTLLATEENAIGMLPQPFVTTAQINNENLQVALDLTEEWDSIATESKLLTGVLLGNTAFMEEHPSVAEDFLAHYETSIDYVNSNVPEAAVLVGDYGIVTATVAELAIPHCSISYIHGSAMKTALSGYLQVLFDANPASIGGDLPDDGFYYPN